MRFADRLADSIARSRPVALLMRPRLLQLPLPVQKFDDPFLPFGKAIVDATGGLVAAYVFDLAAYLSIGAAGAVALERTMAYASARAVTVLHGPFAGPDYVEAAGDAAFNADAVTLVDEEHLAAYTAASERGAFVVRRGESPVIIPLPGSAGVFWTDAGLLTLLTAEGRLLQLTLAGERVLYAGRGEDFAARVRAAVEDLAR